MTKKEIMENILQNSNRLWKIEANLESIDVSYIEDKAAAKFLSEASPATKFIYRRQS